MINGSENDGPDMKKKKWIVAAGAEEIGNVKL